MKISIYIRVSTEDQAKEGYSLEVQREYLEDFAKREGYEIYKVYCDDGISAYSTRREALQQLLKDAKDKKFDLMSTESNSCKNLPKKVYIRTYG